MPPLQPQEPTCHTKENYVNVPYKQIKNISHANVMPFFKQSIFEHNLTLS